MKSIPHGQKNNPTLILAKEMSPEQIGTPAVQSPLGLAEHTLNTKAYRLFLSSVKTRISAARVHAARSLNQDLISLGCAIVEKQASQGWGQAVVERLSRDLQREFPSLRGFSPRNIWEMRRFYLTYRAPEFLQQVVAEMKKASPIAGRAEMRVEAFLRQLVAEVPWGHHLIRLAKVQDPEECLFSLRATSHFGWSRNVLLNQIMSQTYERSRSKGKTHNFKEFELFRPRYEAYL